MGKYINTKAGYIGIEIFRASDSFDDILNIMVSDGYDSTAKAQFLPIKLPAKDDKFIKLLRKILISNV